MNTPLAKPPIKTQDKSDGWVWFPDSLTSGRFRGYENREDVTQMKGAFPIGQNVKLRKLGLPTLREGREVIGTENTDTNQVMRAFVYETRDGDQYEIKILADGSIYYWLVGTSTDWLSLTSGLTASVEWDYGVMDETADATNHVFYGNGTDGFYQFNGAHAVVLSITATEITIEGSSSFTALGFYATGTRKVRVNGADYEYTGGDATTTITGIADTTGITAGDLLVQAPRAVSGLSSVKSSVIFAHDGRLHFRDDAKKNLWWYSKLDNPDDISTPGTGTDANANTKSVEGGGSIVSYGRLNQTILAIKPRVIKALSFIQTGDRIDVPFYQTLAPADDKSTTLGGTNKKSTFATPYGLVFVTPDKRLILLTGVTENNQPQYLVLSDPIQPMFDAGDHREATGICVNNTLLYAFKSSSNASANDTLIVGDMTRQTFDRVGRTLPIQWDTPTVGWSISDFTAIINSLGETEIHFHSSVNSNSYKITPDDKTDDGTGFVATIRTWAEHFGYPELWKTMDMACLVIRMKENTNLTVSILYDENGVTGTYETTITGAMTAYRFSNAFFNPLGASPFGSQKFGSNPENEDLNLYRFFLELPHATKFYNVSLQLSGDIDGNDFELVRFGYRIKEVIKNIARTRKMTS